MSAAVAENPSHEHCNEVHLVGRVTIQPSELELPSGDVLVSWRLSVERPPAERRNSRQSVDVIECVAWKATTRRAALKWDAGDIVEIDGVLRRRFYQAAYGGPASRYQIEVQSLRRLAHGR